MKNKNERIDLMWRLFQKCDKENTPLEKMVLQFSEIYKHGGYEGLAKYIIQNLWVYQIPDDEDTFFLRYMMVSLWKTGQWPEMNMEKEQCHIIIL